MLRYFLCYMYFSTINNFFKRCRQPGMQIFIIEFDFEYFLMMFADGKDADERLRIL